MPSPMIVGRRVLSPVRGRLEQVYDGWARVSEGNRQHWFYAYDVDVAEGEPYRRCRYCGDWMIRVCLSCSPPESTHADAHGIYG